MFAYIRQPLNGEPWTTRDDDLLIEDWLWGCSVFTMAKRALRSEEEVLERLAALGRRMEDQPKPKRRRTWTG
jgi:hypothetical protein